jgi:hypothetical protein
MVQQALGIRSHVSQIDYSNAQIRFLGHDPLKPFAKPNVKINLDLMFWAVVNNANQIYNFSPNNTEAKRQTNIYAVKQLIDLFPTRQYKMFNNFFTKHPITASSHFYDGNYRKEYENWIKSNPVYGVFKIKGKFWLG